MSTPKPVIAFKVQLKRRDREPVFHRFSGAYNFSELSTVISHLWGERPKHLVLDYTDDEGDLVRFTSESEWEECVRIHLASGATVLRLIGRRHKDTKEKRQRRNKEATNDSQESDSEGEQEKKEESPAKESSSRRNPLDAAAAIFEEVMRTAASACSRATCDSAKCTSEEGSSKKAPRAAPKVECDTNSAAVDLMSLMYGCDAGAELFRGNTEIFGSVVKRVVNPFAPSEVHLDVDRTSLYRDAVAKGNAMIDEKKFLEAERIIRVALVLFPDNVVLEYNLACVLSLQDRLDEAIELLLAAKSHGYDDMDQLANDSDLENVRKHARFAEIVPPTPIVVPEPEHVVVEAPVPAPAPTPAPAAPVVETVAPTTSDVDPQVMTLLSIFPDMSIDEAKNAMHRAGGNLSRAVNARLSGN